MKHKSNKTFNTALFYTLFFSSLALTACGGSSGSNDNHEPSPKPTPDPDRIIFSIIEKGDIFSGKPYVLLNSGTDDVNDYQIQAKYGIVSSTHPHTGAEAPKNHLYYYVPEETLKNSDDFYNITEEITITSTTDPEETEIITYTIGADDLTNGDPVFKDQWHIKNIGQNPFDVDFSPVSGIDLNVIHAWHLSDQNKELISGKNVKVGIIDTPTDIEHEDLINKMYTPDSGKSYINTGVTQDEVLYDSTILHGTAVSGIIGAESNNGKGVRGIAYDSSITSYDILNMDLTDFTACSDDGMQVLNASIGYDESVEAYDPQISAIYQSFFENNIPFIRAAGNEFDEPDIFDSLYYISDLECVKYKIECQYNQTSSFNRGRYVIHTGALNSLGIKSSYSSTGSFIWISGMGGEFGYASSESSAAIVSSLYHSALSGFDDWDYDTPWRNNKELGEKRKYYTQSMNGTSAATPSITGVASLIIQAKPDITVPQLRYILATTANNDQTDGWNTLEYDKVTVSGVSGLKDSYTADLGWYGNGAGLRFSNRYGFGVANAGKAVIKALNCNSDPLCKKREKLPDDFISTNSEPCSSSDSGHTVTCIFNSFVNADDNSAIKNNVEIEEVSLNLSSLVLTADDTDPDECSASYGSINNITDQGIYYSKKLMQIDMTSPQNTASVIKPMYTIWDFSPERIKSTYHYNDYDFEFLVHNSSFFTEEFSPDDSFSVTFRSMCSIDVATLNRNIYILVGGYENL